MDEFDRPLSEAERRDRRIGQDMGQGGADNTQHPSQPNKSKMGATDGDPGELDDKQRGRAASELNRGDLENLGMSGGQDDRTS